MKRLVSFFWLLILVLSAPLTMAGAEMSPANVEGATTVDAAKAKALWDEGVLFVDVRPDKDWELGRIPGAVHLELNTVLSEESLSEEVKKHEALVMYCNGMKCKRSSKGCAQAVAWGFTKVYYFRSGMPDWKAAGYPVE